MSLNRREFLRYAATGAMDTALITIGVTLAGKIQGLKTQTTDQEYLTQIRSHDQALEVKHFARDILITVSKTDDPNPITTLGGALAGFWAGDAIGGYLLRNSTDLIKRRAILGSLTVARVLDVTSTCIGVSKTDDPRFTEYGFNHYFRENTPLRSPNPSVGEVASIGLVETLALLLATYKFRFFDHNWRGYAGASPFIAANNTTTNLLIPKCLDLGDQIKILLNNGAGKEEVYDYLSNILPKSST